MAVRVAPTWEPPVRPAFWAQYVTTMRPYLLPVSALAGLAGMALADVPLGWRWGVSLAVFTLLYGLGQALVDCFQIARPDNHARRLTRTSHRCHPDAGVPQSVDAPDARGAELPA